MLNFKTKGIYLYLHDNLYEEKYIVRKNLLNARVCSVTLYGKWDMDYRRNRKTNEKYFLYLRHAGVIWGVLRHTIGFT